jgi:hypothetical protein
MRAQRGSRGIALLILKLLGALFLLIKLIYKIFLLEKLNISAGGQ